MTLLSRFTSWSNEPALPPISDSEAQAFSDALARPEPRPISDGEPRREQWQAKREESWAQWLHRSATSQPSHGDAE